MKEGPSLPGTGQLKLGSAAFYDVRLNFPGSVFPDGTATVCVSPILTFHAVTAQTVLQYWNSGSFSWVNAGNQTTTPSGTICGNMPVAALSGTPIAVGPLSTTQPQVDLAAKVQSLTLQRGRDLYLAVVTITNGGSLTAGNLSVPLAELNGTPTSTSLPTTLWNLSYAASATFTLRFPARAAANEDFG